jgi:hypothetical protein
VARAVRADAALVAVRAARACLAVAAADGWATAPEALADEPVPGDAAAGAATVRRVAALAARLAAVDVEALEARAVLEARAALRFAACAATAWPVAHAAPVQAGSTAFVAVDAWAETLAREHKATAAAARKSDLTIGAPPIVGATALFSSACQSLRIKHTMSIKFIKLKQKKLARRTGIAAAGAERKDFRRFRPCRPAAAATIA